MTSDLPLMCYCLGQTGTYHGTFEGKDLMLSAGVAWNNPGHRFQMYVPDETGHVIVDSGGFQATGKWNLNYPYRPEDYFEWAESIGADEVALPDFACEPDLHESDPIERVKYTIRHHIAAMNEYEDGDYDFDVLPVLQGWEPKHYEMCAYAFEQHGLDTERMAIGTVCKREKPQLIVDVLNEVESVLGHRKWHLFGLTLDGWKDRRLWRRFYSSDTAAWGFMSDTMPERLDGFGEYEQAVEFWRDQIRFADDASLRVSAD